MIGGIFRTVQALPPLLLECSLRSKLDGLVACSMGLTKLGPEPAVTQNNKPNGDDCDGGKLAR